MSKSVIRHDPFNGIHSPQTPREDSHMQLDDQVGSPSVPMKTTDEQSAPVIDSRPAFSLWWKRWREARVASPRRAH
jgi:hypothetical protein